MLIAHKGHMSAPDGLWSRMDGVKRSHAMAYQRRRGSNLVLPVVQG